MSNRVYLGGGFRGNWHERVEKALGPEFLSISPKDSGLKSPEWFTPMDLGLIELSDIMFVYLQTSNPGLNVIFEAGYAKRAHVPIVVAMDEDYCTSRGIPERYIGMLFECAEYVCFDIEEAASWIRTRYGIGPALPAENRGDKRTLPLIAGWAIDFAEEGTPEVKYMEKPWEHASDYAVGESYRWWTAYNGAEAELANLEVNFDRETLEKARLKADLLDQSDDRPGTKKYVMFRRL